MNSSVTCYFAAVSTIEIEFEFLLLFYIFVKSVNFEELKLVMLFFMFNKFLSYNDLSSF